MPMPPSPLLVTAVFAAALLALRAPALAADSPVRPAAPALAVVAIVAALLAAICAAFVFALVAALLPPPTAADFAAGPLWRTTLAVALLAIQALVATGVTLLLRTLWRRRAPALAVPAPVDLAALIGAVAGLAGIHAPGALQAAASAGAVAALLAVVAAAMPALRERLDAGTGSRRPGNVLPAAVAAVAVAAALLVMGRE